MSTKSMHTVFRFAASLLLLAGLALAPAGADARAGHGFSFGSRGARTFSMPAPTRSVPFGAAPLGRTTTMPSYGRPAYGRGMMGRGHPLAAGLLGGFLGAGLAGMLFGHGFFGGGLGMGHLLGILIQLALIVFAVRWLMRRFSNNPMRTAPAMGSGFGGPSARMQTGGNWAANAPPPTVSKQDYQQFEQTLRDIQTAWTRSDIGALQQLATPEMVTYFGQQLQEQAGRGVRNAVSDVRLDRGDLSEAWAEGSQEFATVAMRYSMVDVTTDGSGRVVDGSPTERVSVAEFWTFVRASGARWLLSAIQQGR